MSAPTNKQDARQHPRSEVVVSAELVGLSPGADATPVFWCHAWIRDVSVAGLRLQCTPIEVPVGWLVIRWHIPATGEWVTRCADVRHADDVGYWSRVGLKFCQPPEAIHGRTWDDLVAMALAHGRPGSEAA